MPTEINKPEKFVIAFEDENTIAASRPPSALPFEPLMPLAPGPAIVVPVRSGISARFLALVAVAALVCGALGGWALGLYQTQGETPPVVQSEETPPAEENAPLPAPAEEPARPEVAFTGTVSEKKETPAKPVLKPAKSKPVKKATPPQTEATPEKSEESAPNNGETRPRRANNGSTERAGRDGKAPGRDNGELHHPKQ